MGFSGQYECPDIKIFKQIEANVPRKTLKHSIIVCIHAPLRGLYPSIPRLIEHIELNFILGTELYVIYNTSGTHSFTPIFTHYMTHARVKLHPWNIPDLPMHNGAQVALINDCILRYMHDTKWILLIDFDEYLVPQQHLTWQEMLNSFKSEIPSVLSFRNVFFRMNQKDDTRINETVSKGMVTPYKVIRDEDPDDCPQRSKMLVRPVDIKWASVHTAQAFNSPGKCIEATQALLQHYRSPKDLAPAAGFVIDRRLQNLSSLLVTAINKIGMIPY